MKNRTALCMVLALSACSPTEDMQGVNPLNYYAKHVYVDQKRLGEINPDRLAKLQDFYLEKGFIQKKTPVEELYTNQFIK